MVSVYSTVTLDKVLVGDQIFVITGHRRCAIVATQKTELRHIQIMSIMYASVIPSLEKNNNNSMNLML